MLSVSFKAFTAVPGVDAVAYCSRQVARKENKGPTAANPVRSSRHLGIFFSQYHALLNEVVCASYHSHLTCNSSIVPHLGLFGFYINYQEEKNQSLVKKTEKGE